MFRMIKEWINKDPLSTLADYMAIILHLLSITGIIMLFKWCASMVVK